MRKLIRGGTIFLWLALMGAVLLSGCDFLNPPEGGASPLSTPPPPRLTPVAAASTADTSVKVKRNDLSAQVKLRGRVVATTELNLSFRRAGWIKSLGVEIGDQVEQGTLLAELEDPDLEERLTAARSALELGRSTLAQAQLPLSPGRIAAAAETVAAAEYEV